MDNIFPVGHVETHISEKVDQDWGSVQSVIVVGNEWVDGLKGLETFSHILVVYHLNEAEFVKDKHLVRRPRDRADLPLMGVFARRTKDRPNRIGVTAVKLVKIEHDKVHVEGLDAINGTPVLDIKPYMPQFDKRDATVPEWVDEMMKDYF